MHATLEVRAIDIGPVSINLAEGSRSGTPLVMLHGGSARWQSYQALLEAMALRWHVYAPDLRGRSVVVDARAISTVGLRR